MIPERNLLKGIVGGKEKGNVLKFLVECLEEGGTILLRIPKLYHCISLKVSKPDHVLVYASWRDKVEQETLIFLNNFYKSVDFQSLNENVSLCISKYIQREPLCFWDALCSIVPELKQPFLSGTPIYEYMRLYNERAKNMYLSVF
jgi:hypothetical protein